MSLRNLLIITYHFPPSAASGAFRMLGFARHLPSHGWNVSVVAPPSLPWEPVDQELCRRLPASTRIEHVPYPDYRFTRRIAQMGCWLPSAWSACRRLTATARPDAVLTSGPPHLVHYLGLALKRTQGLPWIADFRDPWYAADRLDRGVGWTARGIRLQERLIVESADRVVANAPGAERTYRIDYPAVAEKFSTLPNGYDREAFDVIPALEKSKQGSLRVVHTGAIYLGRDPRPFLDALQAVNQSQKNRVLEAAFFGPPPEQSFNFPSELASRGLSERVVVHGQVPYARCLQEMKWSDILLLMDTPGRSVGVPAKLYEYIGSGRPILALGETGGDLEWVLRHSGIPYRIAPPDAPSQIAEALKELTLEASGMLGFATRNDPFSRENIVGRLAELLDEVVQRPRPLSGVETAESNPDADHMTRYEYDGAPLPTGGR